MIFQRSMPEYDNTAFYYFAISLLALVVIPDTFFVSKKILNHLSGGNKNNSKDLKPRTEAERKLAKEIIKEEEKKENIFTLGFAIHVLILAILWASLFYFYLLVKSAPDVMKFDPYEVLGISETEDMKVIKSAYRALSRKLHPDVNQDDPQAQEKFMKLAKAYEALTDPTARENWKKFGNPDGPGMMSVSIGLPSFVLDGSYKYLVMTIYLVGLVILIPIGVYYWHLNSSKYGENNVHLETYKYFGALINGQISVRSLPEVLSSAGELNDLQNGRFNEEGLALVEKKVASMIKDGIMQKPNIKLEHSTKDKKVAGILSNNVLIHMWLSRQETDSKMDAICPPQNMQAILTHSMKMTEVMLEFVANPRARFLIPSLSCIDFMQVMTQRLWLKDSHYLQLPHFTASEIKLIQKKPLREYILQRPEERKGMAKFDESQRRDAEAVLAMLPVLDVKCRAYTEDEDAIYAGDLVTIEVTITRLNLKEGEKQPHVYAPHFPVVKNESWWVLCSSPQEPPGNMLVSSGQGIKKITSLARETVIKDIKVVCPKEAGTYSYNVFVKSSDYLGLDVEQKVTFTAKPESEAPAFVAHPEDSALDKEPTLFQQLYGKQAEEESDSSDDEDEGDHGHSHAGKGGDHGHSHNGQPCHGHGGGGAQELIMQESKKKKNKEKEEKEE